MDWYNSHLHEFQVGKVRFESKRNEMDSEDEADDVWFEMDNDPDVKDEESVTLADVVKRKGSKILYTYDFGDDWEHQLELEEKLPADTPAPRCLAGKMAGPPEDSGGMWGYEYKLDILKDPKHEEYEDIVEWMGDDFDPKAFALDEINARHATLQS